jgi:FkbM family methyltransferase
VDYHLAEHPMPYDFDMLARFALRTLSRTNFGQRLLERSISAFQSSMGIGSGGLPESSGERILCRLLGRKQRLVHRPLCIFDVGANHGQFLEMLVEGLGATPKVIHAFEPGAAAFRELSRRHGSRDDLRLNQLALGGKNGKVTLHYDHEGSGLASFYNRRLEHFNVAFEKSEVVDVETLDNYRANHGIGEIDLLKLDVEGSELEVLEGGLESFRTGRVDLATFEFGGCNIDSRTFFQDFYYFFKRAGSYDLYRLTPTGHLAPILAYREIDEQFRTTNYLALRTPSPLLEMPRRRMA